MNPHHYDYEPNGNLADEGDGDGSANYFQYDGADQMVGEQRSGVAPFTKAYTYDGNANRLTQTVNGTLAQQFTYDAHDKLISGIGETDSYDLNGNLRYQTTDGQTTTFGWDGEDRLKSEFFPASQAFPSGHEDLFTYTGLGMRLTKHDPTGTYSYLADGVSPASPVLSDGLTASFTPGISQTSGNGAGGYTSRFYMADAQGNSRAMTDGGQALTDTYTYDAFGSAQSHAGGSATAYGWGEESGYQTDQDGGLRLLGHRYYDSRTGRFISQDPAGDGDNWYTYCGNSPTNGSDPSGLVEQLVGTLNVPGSWSEDSIFSFLSNNYNPGTYQVNGGQPGAYTITIPGDPNPGMGAPGGGMGGGGMGGGGMGRGGMDGGNAFSINSKPPGTKNPNLGQTLLGLAVLGLNVLHGGSGQKPTVHLPKVTPEVAQPGKSVKKKKNDEEDGGSKYLANLGSSLLFMKRLSNQYLDYLRDHPFGGGGTYSLPTPVWANPLTSP